MPILEAVPEHAGGLATAQHSEDGCYPTLHVLCLQSPAPKRSGGAVTCQRVLPATSAGDRLCGERDGVPEHDAGVPGLA